MSRTCLILGRRHGKDSMEIIAGPETSVAKQAETLRAFMRERTHKDFECVEQWTSDGGRRRTVRLIHPKEAARRTAAQETANLKAAEARKKAQEKEPKAKGGPPPAKVSPIPPGDSAPTARAEDKA